MRKYEKYKEDDLIDLANQEDAEACHELAVRYREGIGVPADENLSQAYEDMAKQLGYSEEKDESGNVPKEEIVEENEPELENTVEKSEEPTESVEDADLYAEWEGNLDQLDHMPLFQLSKAAKEGNPFAMNVLSERYIHSESESDAARGFDLLKRAEQTLTKRIQTQPEIDTAANLALAEVSTNLGECYENGYGTQKDQEKAFAYYSRAYELDHSRSSQYIHCLENGIGCKPDVYKAEEVREKRAVEGGIDARIDMAVSYLTNNQLVKAAEWFQSALASDDADSDPLKQTEARYFLSQMREEDQNGQPIDYKQEREKLVKASNEGDSDAAYILMRYDDVTNENKKAILEQACKSTLPEAKKFAKNKLEEYKKQEEEERIRRQQIEAERERRRQAELARQQQALAAEEKKKQEERERQKKQAEREEKAKKRMAMERAKWEAQKAEEKRVRVELAEQKKNLYPQFIQWRWGMVLLLVLIGIFTLLTTSKAVSAIYIAALSIAMIYSAVISGMEKKMNVAPKHAPEVVVRYANEFIVMDVILMIVMIVVASLA